MFAGDVVAGQEAGSDIYLLALERLGIGRDDALVVEDSRNGLLAAVGAGLRCVVTVSGYTRDEDFTRGGRSSSRASAIPAANAPRCSPTAARPRAGAFVTLDDLERVPGSRPRHKEVSNELMHRL